MTSGLPLETLQARLAEAQTAYHRLMVGQSTRVVVDQNGERVEFNTATAGRLYAYILGLQTEIAALLGTTVPAPKPIGFVF